MSTQYLTLGLGSIQTCRSGPKVAVLHEKTSSEVCDPQRLVIPVLKLLFFMHKPTGDCWNPYRLNIFVLGTPVMCAQNYRRGLGPIQTWKSGPKVVFCMHKTTGECWNQHRLVILVLKSLFCMHKPTGEGWNPYRLVILLLKTLLWMHKTTDDGWD